MNAGEVWDWLRTNSYNQALVGVQGQFTAQTIDSALAPATVDALWELTSGGLVRPFSGGETFATTERGRQLLTRGALLGDQFLSDVVASAPMIDGTAKEYLALALKGVLILPEAAIALIRVAAEVEVDSVIDALVASAVPTQAQKRSMTRRAPFRTRADGLIKALPKVPDTARDSVRNFGANLERCRNSGNNVLHALSGPPEATYLEVHAVMFCFKDLATEASRIKSVV